MVNSSMKQIEHHEMLSNAGLYSKFMSKPGILTSWNVPSKESMSLTKEIVFNKCLNNKCLNFIFKNALRRNSIRPMFYFHISFSVSLGQIGHSPSCFKSSSPQINPLVKISNLSTTRKHKTCLERACLSFLWKC